MKNIFLKITILYIILAGSIHAQEFLAGDKWEIISKENSNLPSNSIHSIYFDKDNTKWIGTWGAGLVKFNEEGFTIFNKKNSKVPNDKIYTIKEDSKGNIWFGTFGGGFVKYDGSDFTVFNTQNSNISHDWIYDFYIDDNDKFLIGTWGGGLAIFTNNKWKIFADTNSVVPYKVTSVVVDRDKDIWIGSIHGLMKQDNSAQNIITVADSILPGAPVYSLLPLDDGTLWVGYKNDGIAFYDGKTWKYFDPKTIGFTNCYALATDSKNNLWIATFADGLAKYDGKEWTLFNKSNSPLPDNYVFSVSVDKYNNKWISTFNEGIIIFNEDGIKHIH